MENNKISLRDLGLLIAVVLLTVAIILLILFRDNNSSLGYRTRIYDYEYFDTEVIIYDYSGDNADDFELKCERIQELLGYYHKLFDIYNEYDGINNARTLNLTAKYSPVKVDGELIDLLLYAKEIHLLTDGNVNVAMGSVLSVWHNYRKEGKVLPSDEELNLAKEHTDISKIVIDEEESTVFFADREMSLDLGAIAKGYAAEKIAEALIEDGISSMVLNLGGNLKIIGTKPDGTGWRTGIRNPDLSSDEEYIYYVDVADTSVVTSGDYQRFYTVNGKNYHHIIDKDTLYPADYFSSVTVICKNSALADSLSTALFNMEYEEGIAFLSGLDGVGAVFVLKNGEIRTYGIQ